MVVRDGVLFRQWEDVPGKGCNKHLQLVVPRSWIGSVLQQLHSSPSGGHLGMFKTLEKVRSRFYWPGQRHDIEDWCRACELCAARKSPPRRNRAPMQQVLAGGPFQRVAMDILGPLPLTERGNKYILNHFPSYCGISHFLYLIFIGKFHSRNNKNLEFSFIIP